MVSFYQKALLKPAQVNCSLSQLAIGNGALQIIGIYSYNAWHYLVEPDDNK
jgi:hypothetical protein